MRIADKIKDFFQRRREKQEQSLYTIVCPDCGQKVNVKDCSSLCPHPPIEEFIWRDWKINREK